MPESPSDMLTSACASGAESQIGHPASELQGGGMSVGATLGCYVYDDILGQQQETSSPTHLLQSSCSHFMEPLRMNFSSTNIGFFHTDPCPLVML